MSRYHKPLVAFLSVREDIVGLPEDVYVETDLEAVKDFVRAHIW